jgi:hypothetical protein
MGGAGRRWRPASPDKHQGAIDAMAMTHISKRAYPALIASAIVVDFVAQAHAAPDRLPDSCGASRFTQFIGKPVTDLENMNPPDTRFVCKEDCVTTADVRASRLTVIYSRKSKRILSLACG